MELGELKEHLQSFFNESVLTIVGSGLSSAEGIPGMYKLGEELIKNVPNKICKDSITIWENIEQSIKRGQGLEETLLKNKPSEDIEEAIKIVTEQYIRESEENVIKKIAKKEQKLRFSDYIKKLNISTDGTKIITTNYDRLVEFACEEEGVLVDNLFTGNYMSKVNEKSNYNFFRGIDKVKKNNYKMNYEEHVAIYKPHGCLGWYMRDGEVIYSSFNLGIENLIITPGANKYRKGYDMPFDLHRTKANDAIDNAGCFVIIGYGFNDDHLETHLINRIKKGIRTLVITRDISKKVIDLIKRCNMTAVYHYENDYEYGTIVNINGEEIILKDCGMWDLGEFVREVL